MTSQTIFEFLSKDRPKYALERKDCTKKEWYNILDWFQEQLSRALDQPNRYTSLEWRNLHDRAMNLMNADCSKMGPATPVYPELCEGYREEELAKIEKIYNISITGQFRVFMKEMGRCSGGLIGWDPIFFYYLYGIDKHLPNQRYHQESMIEYDLEIYNENKPFSFSCESETQYYFMLTESSEPELVYHFDENTETVSSTGMQFIDYMKDLIIRETGQGLPVICRGDLLFDK